MKVIIVGHHARTDWIWKLADSLGESFGCAVIDYGDRGSLEGHMKAIQCAKIHADAGERVVIMEDDAIPVQGFVAMAERIMADHPDDAVSFYLGTSRPYHWQPVVDRKIAASTTGMIRLPELIHGVCYSIPNHLLDRVLRGLRGLGRQAADEAVSGALGEPVWYPVESLVEHRDQGTVEAHPDGEVRSQKRVARALAGPLAYER